MRSQAQKTLKMYALAGIVTAVKAGKITVHTAHIPGLGASVERDYALEDTSALSKSKPGDFVHATLLTNHADIWLLEDLTVVINGTHHRAYPAGKLQ